MTRPERQPTPTAAPPPRPRLSGILLAVPDLARWPAALRTALALGLPAGILVACGFGHTGLLAALGAFAVIYGENRPYRVRWRIIATAGAVNIAAVAGYGALGAWADDRPLRQAVVVTLLVAGATVATFALAAMRFGPPGAFVFVLCAGIAVVVAQRGLDPVQVLVATSAGVGGSMIVGMAPALWRPRGPEEVATAAAIAAVDTHLENQRGADPARQHSAAAATWQAWTVLHDAARVDSETARRLWVSAHRFHDSTPGPLSPPLPRPRVWWRLRESAHLYSHATITAGRVLVGAGIAGAVSLAVGLSRPDWAVLATVLVLQTGPDRVRGSVRGVHRLIGTVIGLGVFTVLHVLSPPLAALVVIVAVLNFLIELAIATNYAVACTFITPLALLMGSTAGGIGLVTRDRFLETLLGVATAVACMWLMAPRAHRRTSCWTAGRVRAAATATREIASLQPVDGHDVLQARRRLQWLLLEAQAAATQSACDDPVWARKRWHQHVIGCALGYDTLAACWQTPAGQPIPPTVRAELTVRAAASADGEV